VLPTWVVIWFGALELRTFRKNVNETYRMACLKPAIGLREFTQEVICLVLLWPLKVLLTGSVGTAIVTAGA
jgi:hypothetical protein